MYPPISPQQIITLHNGQVLGFAVYGSGNFERTLFYCHGFPGSRAEAALLDQEAKELGVTVVALDRPGFGDSTFQVDRRLLDWPAVIAECAERWGIDRFGVVGVSGGGPYAAAIAHQLPNQVLRLGLISSLSENDPQSFKEMVLQNRFLFAAARHSPSLARTLLPVVGTIWRSSPSVARHWLRTVVHGADRVALSEPHVTRTLEFNIAEALKQGTKGPTEDFMILASPWGFSPAEIKVPTHIWHGDADNYVPIETSETLNRIIPGSSYRRISGGGHFTVIAQIKEVLRTIFQLQ